MKNIHKKITKLIYNIVCKIFNKAKVNKYAHEKDVQQLTAHQQLIQQEIETVRATFKDRREPLPPELIKQTAHEAIWNIQLANKAYHYMKLDISTCVQNSFVIYVDTETFYLAFLIRSLNTNQNKISPLRRDMLQEKEYKLAEQLFLDDFDNPVPLDVLTYNVSGSNMAINFLDNTTRTIWLIANYAESFPVITNEIEYATLLNNLLGLTDHPIPVEELIS